ncbi:MAG: hypothetical protein JWR12_259 [Mucilaginibacter sp.]|nr:hypothetical protein [Mucilaginibacter sp.]
MKKIWMAVLLSIVLFSCKKETVAPIFVNNNTTTVTVLIDQTQHSYKISPIFEGLSFETGVLSRNPEFLNINNKVFIQLIKNLGPGLFRIGGDTSDEIDWTGKARNPNTSTDSLTTSDIDRLSAFSKVTGWPVLFGLNFGSNNITAASNEALYVNNSLGNNLYALQAGNEPDIYHMYGLRASYYDVYAYLDEWDTYISAVKTAVPQASFSGPDVANHIDWIAPFAENKNKKVKMINAHYYLTGPASNPSITYHTLLQYSGLPSYLRALNIESSKYSLPYRITECNNIYGGGKAGASDIFASALWALDLMWTIAENNGHGINFHTGTGLFYSPVMMTDGVATAKPEYYAMLAFKYGSNGGTVIPSVFVKNDYNCTAHACLNTDNTYSVTLINKEETENIYFNVQLNKPVASIKIARLAAPSLASGKVTFAGSSVYADGTFMPGAAEQHTINQDSFRVSVPAGSAAVITVL